MSLIPNGRPFYYPLYPEIAPCEENEEIECELLGKKKEELSGSNNNNMNEEDNSVDVLTSIFETQKEKKKRTKTQKNAIFDFLLKSELIEKINKLNMEMKVIEAHGDEIHRRAMCNLF